MTGAPQGLLWNKLRTIIYKFMTHRSFPKMSYDHLCLPLSQGGAQLIKLQLQQHALSLHWLVPLLQHQQVDISNVNEQDETFNIVTLYIIHHLLASNSNISDHRLFFPEA